VFCLIVSCNSKKQPDTSNINVELKVIRFEKDFFEADTNNINASMETLRAKHHNFTNDFLWRILGLEGVDTILWAGAIKQFYQDYMPIYEATKKNNKDVEGAIADTKEALRLVKYYFPAYKLPTQFITFVGPIDAFATKPNWWIWRYHNNRCVSSWTPTAFRIRCGCLQYRTGHAALSKLYFKKVYAELYTCECNEKHH